MKKLLLVSLLLIPQVNLAGTGYLFNVSVNGTSLGITPVANHTYPNAGIKITSPGYTLANAGTQCKPNANGYCLFSASPTAPATITVKGSGTLNVTLCLNGAGPISCQNYNNLAVAKIAKTAYVTNYISGTPTISLCTINQSTGLLQNCGDAGGESVLNGINPQGIILNNTGSMAYITGGNNAAFLYQCSVNANGTFNNCLAIPVTTNTASYDPSAGFIYLNSANTLAYVVSNNSTGKVFACPLVAGSLTGNCVDTNTTNIDYQASGIILNNANTKAYIGNDGPNNTVTVCDVSGTSFTNCTAKSGGSGLNFNLPNGLALNNTETILYVANAANGANTVYGCSTTPNGTSSTFNNCFIATSSIPSAYGITLNATNTLAFVSDYSSTVYSCPINSDGTFGTCVTNSGFSDPVGITLGY